jgi:hypothetical protein
MSPEMLHIASPRIPLILYPLSVEYLLFSLGLELYSGLVMAEEVPLSQNTLLEWKQGREAMNISIGIELFIN